MPIQTSFERPSSAFCREEKSEETTCGFSPNKVEKENWTGWFRPALFIAKRSEGVYESKTISTNTSYLKKKVSLVMMNGTCIEQTAIDAHNAG